MGSGHPGPHGAGGPERPGHEAVIPAARAREHERIRAVYAYYDSSEAEQRKRDGSNPGTRLNAARRWLALRQVITGLDLRAGATILDVGCGSGGDLQRIAREFGYLRPSLHGVDLLRGRIDQARALLPQARLRVAGGEQLDYQDRFFRPRAGQHGVQLDPGHRPGPGRRS